MNRRNLVNRVFLVYSILFPAFSILLNAFDKAGRFPFVLLIVCICLSLKDASFRKMLASKPVIFWVFWSIYSLINWFVIGNMPDDIPIWTFVLRHFIYPLMTMLLVYYEGCADLRTTTKMLIISYVIFLFMGLTMQSAGSGDGIGWDARGGAQLGNSLPLNACALAFLVCFAYLQKWIDYKILSIIIILCTLAILFTATRKAFVALGIILIFLGLAKTNIRKPSNILKFIGIVILIYVGAGYILSHSLMGSRMSNISDQAEVYNATNSVFLSLVGDRAIQYILSWDIFIENPLTGIGIKNFADYADFPYPLHTEYMVQLAEGGLLGTSLYICFIYGLVKSCAVTIKESSFSVGIICLSGVLYILFINFTSWTFEPIEYWVVYGIILAYCKPVLVSKGKAIRFINNSMGTS